MNVIRTLYHLARADFLERVRQYSFLVLLVATVYMSYLFVPPVGSSYQTVALGDSRGIYNSPWMGAMFGILISTLVTVIVFYVIKNTVARDRQTQVGQIIAATPVRKISYVLGKWLSNIFLFCVLLAVMTIIAVVMQLIRAEDMHLDVLALALPLWLIGFPALALVAALAVFFECTPILKGGVGNVLYFFLFIFLLILQIESTMGENDIINPGFEPLGISYPLADMQRTILKIDPDYHGELIIGGAELSDDPLLFSWQGISFDSKYILSRFFWVFVSGLLAMLAALPFDRFDSTRIGARRRKKQGSKRKPPDSTTADELVNGALESSPPDNLTPLTSRRYRSRFLQVLQSELLLLLKGRRWWWYAIAMGLNIACLAVPSIEIRGYLLAAAWFWPILIWSGIGSREQVYNTRQMVYATPHPMIRQFAAQWLAGVAITALTGLGFAIGLIFTPQPLALMAWVAGVLFIPTLALALGNLSGSSRAFEIVYTFLWYIGPLNGVAALDFMGILPTSVEQHIWQVYLLVSLGLLVIAFLGRWRQIRR